MTFVRTSTGEKILCAWDDCRKPGQDEIKVKEQHDSGDWWNYIFCTERHKAFHVRSHREYARLGTGDKGGML